MIKKKPSLEDIKEVEKALNEVIKSEDEFIDVKLIKISHKKYPKIKQFKVAIPKRFADAINLNEVNFRARFILEKTQEPYGESKIKMEIIKEK